MRCWPLLAALALSGASAAAQEAAYAGRPLTEVLRALQAKGLRIVFTSATVSPDLRVLVEPRASAPRLQLDELLAPHGLAAREGPGGIIQVVRAKPAAKTAPAGAAGRGTIGGRTPDAPTGPRTRHREHVTVRRSWPFKGDRGVASETTVDRDQWQRLHGSLAEDPIRAVHALPRVSAVDEYHSEFAVRGSPFRHVDLVVDGVSAPWLQHTAPGRGATGSLAMLTADVLGEATLRAGAFPHRHNDRLGAELELSLREGSRTDFTLRAAISGTSAAVQAEGPLGPSARGSWLVAARHSFLEWPPERTESTRTVFGFSDGLAKIVYDVRPSQRVDVSLLGGVSNVDADDDVAPGGLGGGRNRASAVNLGWRSTFGSLVIRQRASLVRHDFANREQSGAESDRAWNEELAYRADLTRPFAALLLEAGARVARTAAAHVPPPVIGDAFAGSAWRRSGYMHVTWAATPTLTLSPGLRVTSATHVPDRTVTRWMLGEWIFRTVWTLSASAGVSHQLPDLHHVIGRSGAADLRPERATHFEAALAQQVTRTLRWQAGAFSRREHDILREPDVHPRLVDGVIAPPREEPYANALRGSSRGIELLVERRSGRGLSGWAAYSYGRARYTDAERREAFWADFDQRHALTLFGTYRLSSRSSVGAAFHAGSNFPIPGYLAGRGGGLFVAARRNQVRLPAYVRLDARGDRSFEYLGRKFTLFGEIVNVLNRGNVSVASGFIMPSTGEAFGFTDRLLRRRASAGIAIDF